MKPFILAAVLAFGLVMPASAAQRGLDVAEINWFYYDECQNVFWWQTDSEINIWAFRLEHPSSVAHWARPPQHTPRQTWFTGMSRRLT